MRQTTLFLLMLFYLVYASAQYVPENGEKKDLPKNSLGIFINPMVAVMLGTSPEDTRFGAQYKRLLAQNKKLRVGGVMHFREPYANSDVFVAGILDSMITVAQSTRSQAQFELRTGLEWSDFEASGDFVYALDFSVGYSRSIESLVYQNFSRVPNTELVSIGQSVYGSFLDENQVRCVRREALLFGVAPTFGYRQVIKGKWELMATLSPEFFFVSPYKTSNCLSNSPERFSNNPATIEFRLRLLDLTLAYQF